MTRRVTLLIALASCACGPAPRPGDSLLPAAVADVWRRESLREMPAGSVRARRAFEAVYRGPGTLTAYVYDLPSPAGALELAQRWKAAADTVVFYKDNYFAVIRWDAVDRKALPQFVRAMEKNLGRVR